MPYLALQCTAVVHIYPLLDAPAGSQTSTWVLVLKLSSQFPALLQQLRAPEVTSAFRDCSRLHEFGTAERYDVW
jgi:hypothetical protein